MKDLVSWLYPVYNLGYLVLFVSSLVAPPYLHSAPITEETYMELTSMLWENVKEMAIMSQNIFYTL